MQNYAQAATCYQPAGVCKPVARRLKHGDKFWGSQGVSAHRQGSAFGTFDHGAPPPDAVQALLALGSAAPPRCFDGPADAPADAPAPTATPCVSAHGEASEDSESECSQGHNGRGRKPRRAAGRKQVRAKPRAPRPHVNHVPEGGLGPRFQKYAGPCTNPFCRSELTGTTRGYSKTEQRYVYYPIWSQLGLKGEAPPVEGVTFVCKPCNDHFIRKSDQGHGERYRTLRNDPSGTRY